MTHLSQGHLPEGGRDKKMGKKHDERKNDRKTTAPAHELVCGGDISACRFSYTEAKMSTIGSIYVRSKKPLDNRSKMLQVRTEPQADSVGEHNASTNLSGIQ